MKIQFLSFLLLFFCTCTDSKTTGFLVYSGEIPEYSVEITDFQRENRSQWTRIVHLNNKERTGWHDITGHDYESDNLWEAIFRCGYPDIINRPVA